MLWKQWFGILSGACQFPPQEWRTYFLSCWQKFLMFSLPQRSVAKNSLPKVTASSVTNDWWRYEDREVHRPILPAPTQKGSKVRKRQYPLWDWLRPTIKISSKLNSFLCSILISWLPYLKCWSTIILVNFLHAHLHFSLLSWANAKGRGEECLAFVQQFKKCFLPSLHYGWC